MEKDLEKYIGSFFIHTAKAIRKGHPADRLFCVAEVKKDEKSRFLCAWKVCRKSQDVFWHPVFGEIPIERLSELDLCLSRSAGAEITGSDPSACFHPDSFYQRVTLQEAVERLVPEKPGWKS